MKLLALCTPEEFGVSTSSSASTLLFWDTSDKGDMGDIGDGGLSSEDLRLKFY